MHPSKPDVLPLLTLIEIIEDAARGVVEGSTWVLGDPTDEACMCGLIAAHAAEALQDRAMVIAAPPLWQRRGET